MQRLHYFCNQNHTETFFILLLMCNLKQMKKRKLLMAVALLTAVTAQAQWRVGVTGGADYNVFSMDHQYIS